MLRKKFILLACSISALLCSAQASAQSQATLTIHLDQKHADVSPGLYGLMTEEINYSYDGGLYAEMVRNRTFRSDWTGFEGWLPLLKGNAAEHISPNLKEGPTAALPTSLKLEVTSASAQSPAGISNEGYWGMSLHANTTYSGSFIAKLGDSAALPMRLALVNDDTGSIQASTVVSMAGQSWTQYKYSLQTQDIAASSANHLVLSIDRPATLLLQLVSLMPPTYLGRANGNRVDLMEKLAAMHPAFLRMPGGNYLEGGSLAQRFDWKKTIGPLEDRPTHQAPWSYHSSDGLGLLEFLEWCEDLHMDPVLAVYAGYSLNGDTVQAGAKLEPYVQDALDEIEYVTGGPGTKWGAVRGKNGHPQPFPLHYVEVGNEDSFDKKLTYEGRFAQFNQAIHARYPALKVIATDPVKQTKADVLDDHYYKDELGMFAESRHYDTVDRKGPRIFVGEWATREGTPTTNLGAALGDAAFMTGLERNSDLVIMASYAPLFVNVNPGGMQWTGDLIGYDVAKSYGSPSYYTQIMFNSCMGDYTPESAVTGAGSRFFYSVTASKQTRKACVKLVNASSEAQSIVIHLGGGTASGPAQTQTLSGKTIAETNSLQAPERVIPVRSTTTLSDGSSMTLPPYSIQTLEVPLQ